ncbi:hypothetical protein AAHA92_25642 [Salvia divinorum]|uniref:Uncharacterized protein n=1 Tax=Salvia divinorum TaxID=28513 RepID=A0ABD1GEI1_SALDI
MALCYVRSTLVEADTAACRAAKVGREGCLGFRKKNELHFVQIKLMALSISPNQDFDISESFLPFQHLSPTQVFCRALTCRSQFPAKYIYSQMGSEIEKKKCANYRLVNVSGYFQELYFRSLYELLGGTGDCICHRCYSHTPLAKELGVSKAVLQRTVSIELLYWINPRPSLIIEWNS